MKRSSTTPSAGAGGAAAAAERAAAGRGSRMLTEWVLDCLQVYGSQVDRQPDGSWSVRVGAPLVKVLRRPHLELAPAREAAREPAREGARASKREDEPGAKHEDERGAKHEDEQSAKHEDERGAGPEREALTWEAETTQRLIAFVRDQGQASELWLTGVDEEEGLRIVSARLEVEGVEPRLTALKSEARPLLAYNYKVRWQGSEGREELRSIFFDPATGAAREVPPADQDDFGPPPARRPVSLAHLPVEEGFAKAREVLLAALATKLNQRTQRARATASDEEARLNAYYSQLLREEQHASQRRGEKRARERSEQLKREWRQKLEALSRGGEEARYGLVSAAVVWVPWLEIQVDLGGRPKLTRTTELDLHLKRWEGLTCDACGKPHTWLRREGQKLVGRDCLA